MKKKILVGAAFILLQSSSFGQFGMLDLSFDGDGIVRTNFPTNFGNAEDVAFQSDGKILVAFNVFDNSTVIYRAYVGRYLSNGSLDNTFGTNGMVEIDFDPSSLQENNVFGIEVFPDDRIAVAGKTIFGIDSDAAVAVLNADGTFDTNFHGDGKETIHFPGGNGNNFAKDLKIDPNGRIIAAGFSTTNNGDFDFSVMRFLPDGNLDPNFASNGMLTIDFFGGKDEINSVALTNNGRIVVGGYAINSNQYEFAVAMIDDNGNLVSSFDGDGKVTIDFDNLYDEIREVLVLANGSILAAGSTNQTGNIGLDIAACLLTPTGALDLSFSTDGKEIYAFSILDDAEVCYAAAVQADGKIVLGGTFYSSSTSEFALLRINPDGTTDNTFGAGGIVLTDVGEDVAYGLGIQPSTARIILVGSMDSDIGLARYTTGLNVGILEFISENNVVVAPNPVSENLHLEYELNAATTLEINLIDQQGRAFEILSTVEQEKGKHTIDYVLPAGLSNGTYFVAFKSPQGNSTVQIVVQSKD